MITTCAFDLGNTLSNDTVLYDKALRDLAARLAKSGHIDDAEQFVSVYDRANQQFDEPFVSHTFGEAAVFAAAFAELGVSGLDPEEALSRYRELVVHHTELEPAAREGIEWLREQGVRTALLSNERSARVNAWFVATGAEDLFDVTCVSERLGAEKPDRAYFEAALAEIGVPADEILMFGDNAISDGASKAIGIRFVHVTAYFTTRWYFERGETYEPDLVLPEISIESLKRCLAHFNGDLQPHGPGRDY